MCYIHIYSKITQLFTLVLQECNQSNTPNADIMLCWAKSYISTGRLGEHVWSWWTTDEVIAECSLNVNIVWPFPVQIFLHIYIANLGALKHTNQTLLYLDYFLMFWIHEPWVCIWHWYFLRILGNFWGWVQKCKRYW